MYVPGSTPQRVWRKTWRDAPRDIDNASRSHASEPLAHTLRGRTTRRTAIRGTISAGDATPAPAPTGTHLARCAGAPNVGNLRFPRQPFASLQAAHQMHACGPFKPPRYAPNQRRCYPAPWGTAGVRIPAEFIASPDTTPLPAGAWRCVLAIQPAPHTSHELTSLNPIPTEEENHG